MAIDLPYRAPREGNPNWPLPPDYHEMGPDEQRDYRLAVCRTQETEEDFVVAFLFFESYYLVQSDEDEEGATFFRHKVPNAPFHISGIRDFFQHDYNVMAAPRGFAKSVKWAQELPLFLLLSRAPYIVAVCQATDALTADTVIAIRDQLDGNPRIDADWGRQKKPKGLGRWSEHRLDMKNGSKMLAFSVLGKKRGARPDLFILDDPEYDPKTSTNVADLTRQLDVVITKQVIPMLRPGCKLIWLGTCVNRRLLLYHALQGADRRFAMWNRVRFRAFQVRDDGGIDLLWPEMFNYEQLMMKKSMMGASHFAAEYLNEPVADEDRIFHIHPVYHSYELVGNLSMHPLDGNPTIHYVEMPRRTSLAVAEGAKERSMPFLDFVKTLRHIIMPFDYAETTGPHSDWSVAAIVAFTVDFTMWVLDLWVGKVTDNALVAKLWQMGCRWRPKLLCSDHKNQSIAALLSYRLQDFLQQGGDPGWRPRFVSIKNAGRNAPSKSDRIGAEEWRFNAHRIKMPLFLRDQMPWSMFFQQVEDFTKDLNLLEHDDTIDTVFGMPRYVVRVTESQQDALVKMMTPEQYLDRGQLTDDLGMPLYPDPNTAPEAHIDRALDMLHGREQTPRQRRRRRPRKVF